MRKKGTETRCCTNINCTKLTYYNFQANKYDAYCSKKCELARFKQGLYKESYRGRKGLGIEFNINSVYQYPTLSEWAKQFRS